MRLLVFVRFCLFQLLLLCKCESVRYNMLAGVISDPDTSANTQSPRDDMDIVSDEETLCDRARCDTHINAILGAPVHLDQMPPMYPSCLDSRLKPYDLKELNIYRSMEKTDTMSADTRMVMIVPRAMAMVAIVRVSPQSGVCDTWVQHVAAASPQSPPQLHRASVLITGMSLPADCVVHAMLYTDNNGTPVLGLFDASSVGCRQLQSEPPLTRHMCMRKAVPEQTLEQNGRVLLVRHLWVGCEGACLQALTDPSMIPNMSFAVRCIGILPRTINNDVFTCKMLPLVLPAMGHGK